VPQARAVDADETHGRMEAVKHAGPLPWVQLRNAIYHPSIFRKMIGRIDPAARNGDLVTVYDRDAQVFGTGMLSLQANYGLRMLTFDAAPVEESIIGLRLERAALLRRDTLGLDSITSAYRVVHAEGDGLPGMIVDRFDQYAVVELFSFPMYRRVETIKEELKRVLGVKEVLVRADARVQDAEGFIMREGAPTGPQVERSADRKSVVIT